MSFRSDFYWGAASAAYQCEGAAFEDGKGWSVWDMMCRKNGAIYQNQNGDVACDHYHRYKEDVALMKEIGLKAYRFSLSWPRILPEGMGKINPKGIAFYDNLINELLDKGIVPFVTLFHWDYPYALYCRGGWLNPDSPKWFAEYAKVVVEHFSDRVKHWMTLNEPQCFIGQGHQIGYHAPGDKLGLAQVLLAGHHSLVAHGRAVQVIREYAKTPPMIGYAPVGVIKVPVDESSKADIEAARKAMFRMEDASYWNNTWWMDPVFLGHYPEDGLKIYGQVAPKVAADEMTIISSPVDFCGANIYNGRETYADADGQPKEAPRYDGFPMNSFDWPIVPESLYWGPRFYYERYKKPVIITENGMTNLDWPSVDDQVHDPQRIDFIARYVSELKRACADGVDVRGYFHWSITDNFEWAQGYNKRFGLIYVDYRNQKRILKDSALYYKKVIASNGGCL